MARLMAQYKDEIRGKLQEQFGYKNPMQIPKLGEDRHEHGGRQGGAGQQEAADRDQGDDPDRRSGSPMSARRESRLRTSSFVKAWRSAARSPCAAAACTSFSIV